MKITMNNAIYIMKYDIFLNEKYHNHGLPYNIY